MTLLFALAAMTPPILGGQAEEPHHNLPIDLPNNANVQFELDSGGKDLMPVLDQLLNGGFGDAPKSSFTVKTPLGDLKLRRRDVEEFIRPIRELHIVSYSAAKVDSPLEHYRREFEDEHYRHVASLSTGSEMMVMQQPNSSGRYALVLRQNDRVTVVRTDGMPDLGIIGQLALESIGKAAQHVVRHK